MAVWCTRSDLEEAIGETAVANLADLDSEGSSATSTEDRITAAIAAADDAVKSRVRGKIDADDIAAADAPPHLKRCVVKLAVMELQQLGRRSSWTEEERKAREAIFAELEAYATGKAGITYLAEDDEGDIRDIVTTTTDLATDGAMSDLLENY